MSEEEILKECTELAENEHHELGDCWDEEYSSSAIFGLIMLYKQTKKSEETLANKLQEMNIELDKTIDLLSICNKRLESISRELGLTDEHIYGYDYEEIFNAITELKVKEKYWQDCFLEQVKYGNKITVSGDPVIIKNVIDTVTYNYIHKDKLKDMMKYREFKLQQEYKDFEEDVEWRTYKKILEEK